MGLRAAPGGDDYQNIWINPDNPNIILLVSDQGALVSVNKGEMWSSWYNQPTAQPNHVATTNTFPYRLCAGQQESGSVCISSRAVPFKTLYSNRIPFWIANTRSPVRSMMGYTSFIPLRNIWGSNNPPGRNPRGIDVRNSLAQSESAFVGAESI